MVSGSTFVCNYWFPILITFPSCASGRQWCGIFNIYWWTSSIKPRLLFYLCKPCFVRTSPVLRCCEMPAGSSRLVNTDQHNPHQSDSDHYESTNRGCGIAVRVLPSEPVVQERWQTADKPNVAWGFEDGMRYCQLRYTYISLMITSTFDNQ